MQATSAESNVLNISASLGFESLVLTNFVQGSPLSQFIQACLDGVAEPEGLGLEDGILMTRITEAAYAADKSGKTVVF